MKWLLLSLMLPLLASAQEQRCLDLGGDCVCSEPMDVDDGTIPATGHIFSDSDQAVPQGPNSKSCVAEKLARRCPASSPG